MTDVIRDMPPSDRPREKLFAQGPAALSDAELLAVLFGSGVRGRNAVQLARDLLSRDQIGALKRSEFKDILGIGPAKAARVAAAFEFSSRFCDGSITGEREYDERSFGKALVLRNAYARQECLGAAFLDGRHRIVQQRDIFVGTVDRTLVSTRDIARRALLDSAAAVVVWHNHPSGHSAPSDDDVAFTKKLNEALATIDVVLLDHLVVGAHAYFSMKGANLY